MGIRAVSVKEFIQEIQGFGFEERPECDVKFIDELCSKFEDREDEELLSDQDIELLKSIYERRWVFTKETPFNYLYNNVLCNEAWINFALLLDSETLLEKTAYHLLIPTLRNSIDEDLTGSQIIDVPLTQCILTDDDLLVPLDFCISYHKANGLFGMPVTLELEKRDSRIPVEHFVRPLSMTEIQQLQSKAVYYDYYNNEVLRQEQDGLRISRKTFGELLKLVNDSFNKRGLLAATNYNDEEIESAELAYYHFNCYLSTIPIEEKKALFSQRIKIHGNAKRFEDVWNLVTTERDSDEGCIATNTKYFVKLLLDYYPDTVFGDAILSSETMMEFIAQCTSQKKIIYEYSWLEKHDIGSMLKRIKQSIDNDSFACFYMTGSTVKTSEGENKTVPDSVKKISQILTQHQGNACYAYMMIIENVVIPKLESSHYFRYDETDKWLLDILIIPSILFEPKALCTKLFKAQLNNSNFKNSRKAINTICEQLTTLHRKNGDFTSEEYQQGVYNAIVQGVKKLSSDSDKRQLFSELFFVKTCDVEIGNEEFNAILKDVIIDACARQASVKSCKGYWSTRSYRVFDPKAYETNRNLLLSNASELKDIDDIQLFADSTARLLLKDNQVNIDSALKRPNSNPSIAAVL